MLGSIIPYNHPHFLHAATVNPQVEPLVAAPSSPAPPGAVKDLAI